MFFRRNANSVYTEGCKFDGKCEITVETRRFCKGCRLEKCFEVGMRKEWIMTEEKKTQKRKIIEENRIKRNKENSSAVEANGEVGYALEDDSVYTVPNSSLTPQSDTVTHPSISLKISSPSTSAKNLLLNKLEQTSSDMVIVPKKVLTQLLQENSKTPCICTCSCGRYPQGSCFVNEVKK
ncbi:hypothetical protein CRE_14664 [Caenorhabditis remanei]|uniref:Nuclear receptor domain-containing protein n=1 Tax=Caenorhabditis remanei TaxID=31234 RepID=E3M9F1_CAERE|nr:hypothetical protein CRE_14664 [Caenorhabditis remanei]